MGLSYFYDNERLTKVFRGSIIIDVMLRRKLSWLGMKFQKGLLVEFILDTTYFFRREGGGYDMQTSISQ